MDDRGAPKPKKTSVLGPIALVIVLLGLLIAAAACAVRSWTSIEGPPLPEVGYVAMTIGVVFSLMIGIALMELLCLFEPAWLRRKGVAEYARQQRPRAA